jgi:predicted transposase/invertase (TIGR01784 family)
MRYLDPKNDLTFKKIFGEHPDILMDFLNNILPLEQDGKIVSLAYLPAEQVPDVPLFKNSIVDVKCKDQQGKQFIVEMQMLWTESFKYRVLFNASKAYLRQLNKGEDYVSLQPVYALSLVNEEFELQTSEFYHYYRIVNVQNPAMVLKGLSFLFVELPKIQEHNLPPEIDRALWLRFFTEIKDGTEKISEDLLKNPKIKQAIDCLQESAFTKEELEYYDNYWDTVSTERTIREESLEKGEKIGIEKERLKLYKAVQTALALGLPVLQVATIFGLSEESVDNIQLMKLEEDADDN